MSTAITIPGTNGQPINVVGMRLVTPWEGVWFADLSLDPDTVSLVPASGAITITIATSPKPTTLKGTIDPRASGTFVATGKMRVMGGAAGWEQHVDGQHFQPPSGGTLTTRDVILPTAGLVGETVSIPSPAIVGASFMRSAGPARRVLDGLDWYVDLGGVTQLQSRPAATADASLELLDWDPNAFRARLACDAVVLPNTPIADARIGGSPVTIRDVEQTWGGDHAEVIAWCGASPASRLAAAINARIVEVAKTTFLKVYEYRIVIQGDDGRLELQAVTPADGLPNTLPLTVWPGMSGDSAKFKLSSHCLVEFLGGDRNRPIVRGFSGDDLPLERTVDASTALHVGPSAASVDIAGGGSPAGREGDQVTSFFPPTLPFTATAVIAGTPTALTGFITISNPITGIISQGSQKVSVG